MLRLAVCSLLLVCALGANVSQRNAGGEERIMGGQIVSAEDKYPSKCALRYLGNFHCGCVILSPSHILTSARCARVSLTRSLSVHVGSNHINAGGVNYDVNKATEHYDFVLQDVFSPDVTILELLTPMTLSASIQPASLPALDLETPTGTIATLVGWGYSANIGPMNPSLLEATVPVMDFEACKSYYANEGILTPKMLCTDVADGAGVCNGDNGGPMYVNDVLHGLVSWTSDGCALTQGFPNVYTRIASIREWIDETIAAPVAV